MNKLFVLCIFIKRVISIDKRTYGIFFDDYNDCTYLKRKLNVKLVIELLIYYVQAAFDTSKPTDLAFVKAIFIVCGIPTY